MDFSEKIVQSLLRVDFEPENKDAALRGIARIALQSPLLKDISFDEVYQKLLERESAVSTGIGGGVAIPHARISQLQDFLVFVLVAPRGVEFDALDKKKVKLFFAVFAPEGLVSDHLKILASISRSVSRGTFKQELLRAADPDTLFEVLKRQQRLAVPSQKKKLLLLVLYYEKDVQEILEYLVDQGVTGATVIDSRGMGAYISNIPLFAGFLGFMREDRNVSTTIMALIPAEDEGSFIAGIEGITGDLEKTQGAMIMTVDVSFHKGSMSMI